MNELNKRTKTIKTPRLHFLFDNFLRILVKKTIKNFGFLAFIIFNLFL